MSSKTPDKFSLYVPDDDEPEREMPAALKVEDYVPGSKRPRNTMVAGAYDPYARGGSTGDTARTRRPRVDLRKLSEWIKTTQQVKALREDELQPPSDPGKPRDP
jgi:hypothetical protein